MRPGGGGEAGSEGRGTGDDPAPYAVVGTVLDGRFRVEGVLGSGGMATVFRARDLRRGGETVALKLLRPEFSGEPEAVERLRREAAVLERLRHPAIVGFEAQGLLPDGRLYLAMELLEGETLGDRLRRSRRLDVGELVPVLDGVAGALTAAHEAGVIHRDLKPDNIFLLDALPGDARGVKLLDFGISKVYGSASLTRTGQIVGTPRYMAPEQLLGEADLDRRVDVYALGVILYECLTGVPPYVGQVPADLVVAVLDGRAAPLTAVRPELPAEVGAVVMRALSRQRDGRQGTARALLQGFLRAAGLTPRPPAAQAPAAEGPGGRPLRTAALGEMSGPTEPSEERVSGAALVPGTFQALPAVAPRAGAPL
ncbi:MAG TPA: serine/threonine-protein kinase, partial [Polyangiaceae bacterium LLY-WYZ-14_1]|nr:serine/threonine-protein kinase [Polyangiaceae bacterium LLY-WYZ-14_1]